MFQLDLRSGVPICDQIVNGFIRLKGLGLISADEQMPSVRTLASELSVNPNTIQKAYMILEAKGIIYSVKGRGSFVSGDSKASDAVTESAKHTVCEAVARAAELGLSESDIQTVVKEYFAREEKK